MTTLIRRIGVEEFSVYSLAEEVIVVGFKFAEGAPIRSAIFQMEGARSALATDRWGPHAEIDEKGFYGGILDLAYMEKLGAIMVEFGPRSPLGHEDFLFEVPETLDPSEQQLLRRLSDAVADWRGEFPATGSREPT